MLVADEVFGRRLSLRDSIAAMRELDFGAVVTYLAMLTRFVEVAFESTTIHSAEQWPLVGNLLGFMFQPVARRCAAAQITPASMPFTPLSIQALFATAELSGRFSPRLNQPDGLSAEQRELVSRVLLSFQSESFSERLRRRFKHVTNWQEIGNDACAEFIRNLIGHNPTRPYVHLLARIYAFANRQEIALHFQERVRRSLEDWFGDNLAMSCSEYLMGAFLAGAPGGKFSPDHPRSVDLIFEPSVFYATIPERDRTIATSLLEAATIKSQPAWNIARKSTDLADLLYESNQLHITPVISFENRRLVMSQIQLWNIFVAGLPHSSLNAVRQRQGGALANAQVQGIRGEFGMMFEGFVQWLFREWFQHSRVRLLQSYSVLIGGNWSERDTALLIDDSAYIFEIKANTVDLALRASGAFEHLLRLVRGPVEQAFGAAEAFLTGNVRTKEGVAVGAVRRVVPVALIYDSIPLNVFTGDKFEPWMEGQIGMSPFTAVGGRAAVQLLGIDDLESCEATLGAGADPESILRALEARVAQPGLRYQPLRKFAPAAIVAMPGPMSRLIDESKAFVQEKGRALFHPPQQDPAAPA